MRLQIAIPEQHVTKPVLDGALEAVTRLNEQMLRKGETPTDIDLIQGGAVWKPEPPGQEHFDHGALIGRRGHGDCDDWAPLRAARLRVTGEDPGAIAEVRRTGPKRWHATVTRSDGTEDDPSIDAGMPVPGRAVGMRGAWVPSMRPRVHGVGSGEPEWPHLALRPVTDGEQQIVGWQSRVDLPSMHDDSSLASTDQHPVSSEALASALQGAWDVGVLTGADPEQLRRLQALREMCEGASWEEVADMYGPEHATAAGAIVGSFFGKAFKKLKKAAKFAAKPLGKIAKAGLKAGLSFVPGGSLASQALSMASPLLKRSVAKQRHAPPQLRAPAAVLRPVSPVSHRPPGAPAPAGGQQWLPYPYPLPYPVPGWAAPPAQTPGTAWPR